jgi:hypothetical protein
LNITSLYYAEMGRSSPPDLVASLSSAGFEAQQYGWLETPLISLGQYQAGGPGVLVKPSAWLYAVDVQNAGQLQSLRVTVTPQNGSTGDTIIYLATDSGRTKRVNGAGSGESEVGRIDFSSTLDRVYILVEERNAEEADFRVRIDADMTPADPAKTGADGFITRIQGLGGVAEYDQATVDAVFSFHDAVPWQRVYSRSDWDGENYWFQSSSGEVWSFWHGGAIHDRGNGKHLWTLTNLTEAVGLPSGMTPGSLSGTITSWRAFNVVGINASGRLVTYWWSPESGERQWGTLGNGWSLSDLSEAASGGGSIPTLSGPTALSRVSPVSGGPERLEILVGPDAGVGSQRLFWFDAATPADGWRMRVV